MSPSGPAPLRCALVGMPGSGKSTVGRHLARRLDLPFVDLDQRLEERLGCAIKDFFAQQGEAVFRAHESALLAELAAQPGPLVLSTGGGAVLAQANRAQLRAHFSHVVYLRATPEELFRRLKHDQNRPLLQVDDPLAKLRELYRTRDPLYRDTANYLIETRRPTVKGLVDMVAMQLEMAPAQPPPSNP